MHVLHCVECDPHAVSVHDKAHCGGIEDVRPLGPGAAGGIQSAGYPLDLTVDHDVEQIEHVGAERAHSAVAPVEVLVCYLANGAIPEPIANQVIVRPPSVLVADC